MSELLLLVDLEKAWSESARLSALEARRAKAKALVDERNAPAIAGELSKPLFDKDDPDTVPKGEFLINRGPDGWQMRKPGQGKAAYHVADAKAVVIKNPSAWIDETAIDLAEAAEKPIPKVTLLMSGGRVTKAPDAFKSMEGRDVTFKRGDNGRHSFVYKDTGEPFLGAQYAVFTDKLTVYGSPLEKSMEPNLAIDLQPLEKAWSESARAAAAEARRNKSGQQVKDHQDTVTHGGSSNKSTDNAVPDDEPNTRLILTDKETKNSEETAAWARAKEAEAIRNADPDAQAYYGSVANSTEGRLKISKAESAKGGPSESKDVLTRKLGASKVDEGSVNEIVSKADKFVEDNQAKHENMWQARDALTKFQNEVNPANSFDIANLRVGTKASAEKQKLADVYNRKSKELRVKLWSANTNIKNGILRGDKSLIRAGARSIVRHKEDVAYLSQVQAKIQGMS